MANLWTKNGIPLSCRGNDLYSRSGALVGHLVGDRVFRPEDGEYIGIYYVLRSNSFDKTT